MRFGLLADIHEHVEFLRLAIDRLQECKAERIVVLGDVFETGKRLAETVSLLVKAQAVGVWGNHDFGLCRDPHKDLCERYGSQVLDFFATLVPTLEFENILFTHVEPWHDAEDILELWCFEDEEPSRSFQHRKHRVMLHGHHHQWKANRPDGLISWDGGAPLFLDPGHRYLIEIGAVKHGQCALLDTDENLLVPIDLRPRAEQDLARNFGP